MEGKLAMQGKYASGPLNVLPTQYTWWSVSFVDSILETYSTNRPAWLRTATCQAVSDF